MKLSLSNRMRLYVADPQKGLPFAPHNISTHGISLAALVSYLRWRCEQPCGLQPMVLRREKELARAEALMASLEPVLAT